MTPVMTLMGVPPHMLCPECHEAVGSMMGGGSWKEPAGRTGRDAAVASDEEDPFALLPPCFALCSATSVGRSGWLTENDEMT